ncbi:MAG TPA: hypothetical protein DD635_08150 [Flavobacteriales bacterium]|nr:hypothetical protein [Flavobacteriales bacterium]
MNIRQRFLRYGIGVIIGVSLSALFFSGRSCNDWLPGKRIKARLQMEGIQPEMGLQCLLDCEGPTRADGDQVMQWLLAADIIWSESSAREERPCYQFKMQEECPFESLTVCFSEVSTSVGRAVVRESNNCHCDTGE